MEHEAKNPLLTAIINYSVKKTHPQRIILFGSRARGDAETRSDYDIAIEAPEIDDNIWNQFVLDAEEHINTLLKVDLIRLDTAGIALRKRIMAERKLIYEQ